MSNKKQSTPKMGGPMGGMRGTEKAKDFKGTMKNLFNYLKPYRISIFIVVILTIVASIITNRLFSYFIKKLNIYYN